MNDLVRQIIKLSIDKNNLLKIEELIENELAYDPENIDLWLRLALLELAIPLVDVDKSIICLEKILDIDKYNSNALLVLAYIYHYELGGIDKNLFDRLCSLEIKNPEINSMLKYAASWFYMRKNRYLQKKLLRESIDFCSFHVLNYVDLAEIYYVEGQKKEALNLIEKSLQNVKKIYIFLTQSINDEFDITNIENLLNERFKGIYLSDSNYKLIENLKEKIQTDQAV